MTESGSSSLAQALERVGDRWSLLLVEALLEKPLRYGDLQAAIPGIASNVLSHRLKHLERIGVLSASPYSVKPPRAVYTLTDAGRELADTLKLLAQWGARRAGIDEPFRHAICGSPVEARWFCPVCARVVTDDETSEVRFL